MEPTVPDFLFVENCTKTGTKICEKILLIQ